MTLFGSPDHLMRYELIVGVHPVNMRSRIPMRSSAGHMTLIGLNTKIEIDTFEIKIFIPKLRCDSDSQCKFCHQVIELMISCQCQHAGPGPMVSWGHHQVQVTAVARPGHSGHNV